MSKKNNKYDSLESPSTSGSSDSNWRHSLSGNRYFANPDLHLNEQFNRNLRIQQTFSHMLPEPLMSRQNVPNICGSDYCQTNYYRGLGPFSQNVNGYYCHTDVGVHRHTERWQNNDQKLLSLRRWENVNRDKQNNRPGFIFTLMCYNILAQDLLSQHPYLYKHHNWQNLEWSVRWNNILNEIKKFTPDIICLQEVQESHIDPFFRILETIGYSSLYKRRTGPRSDGCALYYKTETIKLVEHATVEFFQPNISILNRDNVGIIAKLSPRLHPTREFVVATTHLLYNPRRQDVRLAQIQVLLTEIERISYDPKSENNYLPIILTGDLNSSPESAVYEFIVKGKLKYEELSPRSLRRGSNSSTGKVLVPANLRITDNCQHVDLIEKRSNNIPTTRSEELSTIHLCHSERKNDKQNKKNFDKNLFSTGTLSHNFSFKSVYNHGHPGNNEGTTFQDEWLTVDYIFYSGKKDGTGAEDKLKLLSRYRLPVRDELDGIHIPNSISGSDHLSLLAKFKLEY